MAFEFSGDIGQLDDEIQDLVQAVRDYLERVSKNAQGRAPVDTGFLRDNIRALAVSYYGDTIRGELESGADYTSFNEYGTSRQRERPFIRPALDEELAGLITDILEALSGQAEMDIEIREDLPWKSS